MSPTPCTPCCTTPQTVNIPGIPGAMGPTGPAGPAGTLVAPISRYDVTLAPVALTKSFKELLNVPAILVNAGTYLIWARIKCDLNGATLAGNEVITARMRRIYPSVIDLSNEECKIFLPIVTTETYSLPTIVFPVVAYTAVAGTQLQLVIVLSDTPSVGSVDANEAEIVALRIY